jgi:ABC-type transporter MlaC component
MLPHRTPAKPAHRLTGRIAALLLVLTLLQAGPAASAEDPAAALRRTVDEGVRILHEPAYQAEGRRPAQHRQLCELLYRDFDFAEFSKRVLADQWNVFTSAQRREFVEVFSKFLAEYYVERLQGRYTDETVAYLGVNAVAPERVVVKTGVTWRGREFPVEVRMHLRTGRWKAYDVSLLGISAVQLYRAQFQEITRTHSPAETIALVRSRLSSE